MINLRFVVVPGEVLADNPSNTIYLRGFNDEFSGIPLVLQVRDSEGHTSLWQDVPIVRIGTRVQE